jgi:hypothetical protein
MLILNDGNRNYEIDCYLVFTIESKVFSFSKRDGTLIGMFYARTFKNGIEERI